MIIGWYGTVFYPVQYSTVQYRHLVTAADLAPDLHVRAPPFLIARGSTVMSYLPLTAAILHQCNTIHNLFIRNINFFHVILGLSGPAFHQPVYHMLSWQSFSINFFHDMSSWAPLPPPSINQYISHAVLTAPLEPSTCPNQ